ncbi:MAG: hypothetical protein JST92_25610 [Deltaproteobacteria bacterium]|nr:hypothetical protein [Deltaproteobacteria bacterium]
MFALATFTAGTARAEVQPDRFSAGGYYRIMARPDLQGGSGQLGFSDLYGRLLNEGPYGMLQMRLNLLQSDVSAGDPWGAVNVRIEGSSLGDSNISKGKLGDFRVSQLFVQAGNILLEHVTWQIGSLLSYPGDLGLYDARPAQLFDDTVGISALWQSERADLLLGFGAAGFNIHGADYAPVLSGGAFARVRPLKGVELGLGAQLRYEPEVSGNRFAPHYTPGINYADYLRHEVVQQYALANANNPGALDDFPKPVATSAMSWKLVGYLGFGNLGPLKWNTLQGNVQKLHPQNMTTETYQGRTFDLYIQQLTDERLSAQVGNEMQLTLVPDLIDAAWGVLFGRDFNGDNTVGSGEDNRFTLSTVLRVQTYLTKTVHLLVESSVATEKSLNGNLWREHYDSIFTSTAGQSDTRGLEYGDTDRRNTWQGKLGFVFNPGGRGIYNRPSLRVLYGVQYSNMQAAWGNSFVDSLDQYNQFPSVERHWHHVVSVEAEGWF